MSVFVDTSAIFAGIDRADPVHHLAIQGWRRLIAAQQDLVSHSLVEVESVALLQRRLGLGAVAALRDRFIPLLTVIELERERRRAVLARIADEGTRDLSFVDRVSFELMVDRGITKAFAYDRHFSDAGFELIGGEA